MRKQKLLRNIIHSHDVLKVLSLSIHVCFIYSYLNMYFPTI